ncbi:DUF503 family protein [Bacillus sp. FJAT-50079]|uniref:DUF503 domain-containing protein n=1 Tax=Bacillus sp. FJAT-50079 TaxID=2833577 RepID=UPI001BC92318|nr:DUF503 family protein [Bacillus sp. FJAT-50079]MBS4207581.1 DUF503 family protein [Bacillus sp. FJAT-50079]
MIGYCECEFKIYDSQSLKEKRAILQRALTRVKQKFNVSIAEVDHHDVWQLTKFAIATVANAQQAAERELDHVIKFLDSFPEWERGTTTFEWL